jgi:hypothetical protein
MAERAAIGAEMEGWVNRLLEELEAAKVANPVVRRLFEAGALGGTAAGVNILRLPNSHLREPPAAPVLEVQDEFMHHMWWAATLALLRLRLNEDEQDEVFAAAQASIHPGSPVTVAAGEVWREVVRTGECAQGGTFEDVLVTEWFGRLTLWAIGPLPGRGDRVPGPRDQVWALGGALAQAAGQLMIGIMEGSQALG